MNNKIYIFDRASTVVQKIRDAGVPAGMIVSVYMSNKENFLVKMDALQSHEWPTALFLEYDAFEIKELLDLIKLAESQKHSIDSLVIYIRFPDNADLDKRVSEPLRNLIGSATVHEVIAWCL